MNTLIRTCADSYSYSYGDGNSYGYAYYGYGNGYWVLRWLCAAACATVRVSL